MQTGGLNPPGADLLLDPGDEQQVVVGATATRMTNVIGRTNQCRCNPIRCCHTKIDSPNAPANEKATVPGMTMAAIRLRVRTNMIRKINTKAAIATMVRSDSAYCLMSLFCDAAPPM